MSDFGVLKILYFIGGMPAGGKERQLGQLIFALSEKRDIEMLLVTMSREMHYKRVLSTGIEVRYLIRRVKKDPSIFFRFNKVCHDFKPDIIHSWDSMTTFYALPTAKTKCIMLIDGSIRDCLSSDKYKTHVPLSAKIGYLYSNVVIANSLAGLKSYGLKQSDKNRVIYNGFDFSRLSQITSSSIIRQKYNLETKFIVGMV